MLSDSLETYKCIGVEVRKFSRSRSLVYSHVTRSTILLDRDVCEFLRSCDKFATIDEHLSRHCEKRNVDRARQPGLRESADKLVTTGLLVSRKGVLKGIRSHGSQSRPNRITTIAIPTRNRLKYVLRCIESVARNVVTFGQTIDFVVADGSPECASRLQARHSLRALAARHGVSIRYVGFEEKATFASRLAQRGGLPIDVVSFGICGHPRIPTSPGAERNTIQLETIGNLIISLDDDNICRFAPIPNGSPSLRLTSNFDPTAFWFFKDRQSLDDSVEFVNQDLVGAHEQLLGQELSAVVDAYGSDIDIDSLDSRFILSNSNESQRILLTSMGVVGDLGSSCSSYILNVSGESRKRLLRSEADYRIALTSRQVLRGVNRPTISNTAFCMAGNLGFDHRESLPPFMPVQRNEDGLFGALFARIVRRGCLGFIPLALLHSPSEKQPLTSVLERMKVVATDDVIGAIIASFAAPLDVLSEQKRFSLLGEYISDIGRLNAGDFKECVRVLLIRRMTWRLTALQQRFNEHEGRPSFWGDDVRSAIDVSLEAFSNESYPVPVDIKGENASAVLSMTQNLVRRFGDLLKLWPEITQTCRELKWAGERFSQEV